MSFYFYFYFLFIILGLGDHPDDERDDAYDDKDDAAQDELHLQVLPPHALLQLVRVALEHACLLLQVLCSTPKTNQTNMNTI